MDFVLALVIALVAIAVIEWLKKPFPDLPSWVWWALAPLVNVGLAYIMAPTAWVTIGPLAFALSTLFYDLIIQWAKRKIEAL